MGKPDQLEEAETIIGLCERFHCLPDQLYAQDASFLQMLRLVELGRIEEADE